MARPRATELTDRELEIMQVYWNREEAMTPAEVRDHIAESGRELTYTTVATLVRILKEKGFLEPVTPHRPFRYQPLRTFDDVSGRFLDNLFERVFPRRRDHFLKQLTEKLTAKERALLKKILREQKR
jgi:BlaI family penicillinase repressor